MAIKRVDYLGKDKHMGQWNNWESRNKPLHLWLIDFSQGAKSVWWRKGQSFQQMMLRRLDMHMLKKKKQLKHLPHTTFKLTQIVINLNVGIKIVKHLEENTGENLCNFKLDKDVLNMISKEKKAIIWT